MLSPGDAFLTDERSTKMRLQIFGHPLVVGSRFCENNLSN
jgi:hypothetical protein